MSICERCSREYWPLRRGYCNRCDARRRLMVGYQCSYVDAEPVREHVKQLQAAGMGLRRIGELAGLTRSVLQALLNGKCRDGHREPPSQRVSKQTADKLLAIDIPTPATLHEVVADGWRIPAVGTVRRLRALVAIGHTQTSLAVRLGWTQANLSKLILDAEQVTPATARLVVALFDELQLTPGTSNRARNHAQKRGWVPPLAWDEDTIDDPSAKPSLGDGDRVSFPELWAEIQDLGLNTWEALDRLGVTASSLERQLDRHEIPVSAELREVARAERSQRKEVA